MPQTGTFARTGAQHVSSAYRSRLPLLATERNFRQATGLNSRIGPRPSCVESRTPTAQSASATSTQLPLLSLRGDLRQLVYFSLLMIFRVPH
jgi:hypothetical protein